MSWNHTSSLGGRYTSCRKRNTLKRKKKKNTKRTVVVERIFNKETKEDKRQKTTDNRLERERERETVLD